jgi:hypothetical protein
VNYVTKVAAKSTDKKASEIGILINASSLTPSAAIPLQGGLVATDGVKAYWRRKDAGTDPPSPDAL